MFRYLGPGLRINGNSILKCILLKVYHQKSLKYDIERVLASRGLQFIVSLTVSNECLSHGQLHLRDSKQQEPQK